MGMGKAPSRDDNVKCQGLSPAIGATVKQAVGIPRSVSGQNPVFDCQA
jgi:hypothetical protein